MRRAMAHQEKAKNRNDPMLKTHYSMLGFVLKMTKEYGAGVQFLILKSQYSTFSRRRAAEKVGNPPIYFLALAGVTGGAAGPAAKLSFTDWGSLSAFAISKLTCHICVEDRVFSKPGIPVMRMPPDTFQ